MGVAGAGSMGSNHIRIVSELSSQFEFMGIFDPDLSRKKLADYYNVSFYPSYEALLEDVDAVIIASPSSLHYKMALQAAEKGVHSLVEKPMAETVEEVIDLQRAFRAKNLVLAVSCVERFSPVIRVLSDLLKEEDLIAVEVHRCSPYDPRIFDVDVVSDLMIHDIDIVLNDIFCSEPLSLEASGIRVFSDAFADYAHAVLHFPSGACAFITASRSTQDKIRTICIHSRDSYIEADMLNKTLVIKRGLKYGKGSESVHYKQYNLTEQIVLPNKEPLKEDIKNFGLAVAGDESFLVEGEQIIRDMKVLDSIHRSIYSALASVRKEGVCYDK